MANQIVYVLYGESNDTGLTEIVGVYSSPELAESALEANLVRDESGEINFYEDEMWIAEVEVDHNVV